MIELTANKDDLQVILDNYLPGLVKIGRISPLNASSSTIPAENGCIIDFKVKIIRCKATLEVVSPQKIALNLKMKNIFLRFLPLVAAKLCRSKINRLGNNVVTYDGGSRIWINLSALKLPFSLNCQAVSANDNTLKIELHICGSTGNFNN